MAPSEREHPPRPQTASRTSRSDDEPETGVGVALVIGGSRGLGLLIARELLRRGHRVVIAARDAEELERASGILAEEGRVDTKVCDIRDRHSVGEMVGDIEDLVGHIDVLMTVAGVIQTGPAESMSMESFEEALDTMTWGPIHAALSVLPAMRRRGRGRIGTVTSIGGMVSPPHLLPYATAKFGAVGFSDGLAAALSGTGITATTVVPGLMRTGSHERAGFSGKAAQEYAWFAPAASLPLLSIDAERAAQRIVDGVLRGRPMVTLTPLTWLAIRVRGLAPATTIRAMGLANRMLPTTPERGSRVVVEGREAGRRLGSRLVDALTTLGSRAAARYNERTPTTQNGAHGTSGAGRTSGTSGSSRPADATTMNEEPT